jgi:hypothetical protein
MTRGVRRAAIAGVTAIIVAACVDLGGPGTGVVSISSLRIAFPTVVIGDILRDSLGAPAPLTLTAFDPSGNPIPGEPISFFALDSTLSIDPDGTVHGLSRDTAGSRVAASAGELQTPPQRIFVSVKPLAAGKENTATAIIFESGVVDTATQSNWSPPLVLNLTGAAAVGAQGFMVTYDLIRSPASLDPGVASAFIGEDAVNKSRRDTTDKAGKASRRVIIRPLKLTPPLLSGTITDTIIVRATVKYLGADVPGSPVDFIVPVSKKP